MRIGKTPRPVTFATRRYDAAMELWQLGAASLRAGFARREYTPVDALDACLARVDRTQGAVNAFVHIDEVTARSAARDSAMRWSLGKPLGPLDGIPVSLKDNLHARGMPTTWGSRLIRVSAARADEQPVASLRAAGAVLFGKTNLPEFALQGVTHNLIAGTTRNPWDTTLTPGGSSGGAAAAVACGAGPLALATDGGGSTRRPASHCGVAGFKPSGGAVARGGGLPEIFLDHEVPGIVARDVADAVALAGVLAPQAFAQAHPGEHTRVLYVPRFADHPVDPGIARCVRDAAAQLASIGCIVDEAAPATWAEEVNDLWSAYSASGLAWMIERAARFPEFALREGEAPDLAHCGSAARASIELGRQAAGTQVFAALAAIRALAQRMDELFARYDAILTPATAALPWSVDASHPAQIDGRAVGPRGHAVFSAFANAVGLPAIALPGGFVNGLPTGFQLAGARGRDAALLALALRHEQAFPREPNWPAAIDTIPAT
jgi:aspartyl-tRNA(Asn)/glutamyl-tRNA(Gln) amidotransferase subunit A